MAPARPPPPALNDPAAFPPGDAAVSKAPAVKGKVAPPPKKASSSVMPQSYEARIPVSTPSDSHMAPSLAPHLPALPLDSPMPEAAPATVPLLGFLAFLLFTPLWLAFVRLAGSSIITCFQEPLPCLHLLRTRMTPWVTSPLPLQPSHLRQSTVCSMARKSLSSLSWSMTVLISQDPSRIPGGSVLQKFKDPITQSKHSLSRLPLLLPFRD